MDHPLSEQADGGRAHRLGIERELENIVGLDQLGRARARQEKPAGIARMAQAHMAERVKHAFVRHDTASKRNLIAGIMASIGHGGFPDSSGGAQQT
jgi:hypothetical protein